MRKNPNIVIFGVGAIGASVGGWVAEKYKNTFFIDKGEVAKALKADGITFYTEGQKKRARTVKVKVVDDLSDVDPPDVIVIVVKNYSLDGVAKFIKDKVGDDPVIVSLANGVVNQEILPKYFSKVIYGVISYNAWLDAPGVVGAQKRGPLVIGTPDNGMQAEMKIISKIFNKGVETIVTPHLQDAAHSKIVVNLTNSLTTLIGHKFKDISNQAIFQKLLTNLTYEGIKILEAAGYKECKLGGMPSWLMMQAGAKLPRLITSGMFEKNVKKMVLSSMAQDVIQRGSADSELDTINGYLLKLADAHGLDVPYNRTIYRLCRERFVPGFEPMDVKEVYAEVKKAKKALKQKEI